MSQFPTRQTIYGPPTENLRHRFKSDKVAEVSYASKFHIKTSAFHLTLMQLSKEKIVLCKSFVTRLSCSSLPTAAQRQAIFTCFSRIFSNYHSFIASLTTRLAALEKKNASLSLIMLRSSREAARTPSTLVSSLFTCRGYIRGHIWLRLPRIICS